MQSSGSLAVLALGLLIGSSVLAKDIVYVTDLDLFTSLAPCVQSAVKYDVMSMTYNNCPAAVTALQSCVCSKNNYYASIGSEIASDVLSSCGKTATEDQASAATMLSAYCSQDADIQFATPNVSVTQYITDVAEIGYLAPCASSQISLVAHTMIYDLCPEDTPLLATCMCQKQQNSLFMSQSINVQVREYCSSISDDLASAQTFFSDYCNLLKGSSSFATASDPPGDMTYYISDMPDYFSLAPCAASALSGGVFTNTYNLCREGPQELASCVCLKSGMTALVSKYITSSINMYCSSNTDDMSSVLAIYNTYCSAAANKLQVSGVDASIAQTTPTAGVATGTSNSKTTTGRGSTSTATGTRSSSSSSSSSSSPSSSTKKNNSAYIIGAVVGVVVGLIILGIVAFLVFRHVRNKKRLNEQSLPPPGPLSAFQPLPSGKPELQGNDTELGALRSQTLSPATPKPPPSPSLSLQHATTQELPNQQQHHHSDTHELLGQQRQQQYQQQAELYSGGVQHQQHSELFGGQQSRVELQGGQANKYVELDGSSAMPRERSF